MSRRPRIGNRGTQMKQRMIKIEQRSIAARVA